jgi:type IV secretion system protein VirB9
MKKWLAAAGVGLLLTSPALAGETPKVGPADPAVRTAAYNEWQVYHLTGALRSVMVLEFGPDEKVENIGLGNTAAWDVRPVDNVLFLKPREKAAESNGIIQTRTGAGKVRLYQVALSAAESGAPDMMTVKFTYPGDAAAERKLKAEAEAERDRRRQTASESQNAIFDGLRNWAYTMAGQTSFEPVAVWDNGRATAFQFAGQTQVPAVYVVDDDNTERMATFHMQNGMLVAHEVARQWRLRLGGQIICVFNEQYAQAAGPPRGSGTGSSSWMRQVIAGDQ